MADLLDPQGKLDPPLKGPLRSTLKYLDMKVSGCQKATWRVCKMKPSGAHRQSHVSTTISQPNGL